MRTSTTLPRLLAHPNTPIDAALPNTGFPFRFIQLPPSAPSDVEVIETDVVIVGSGCGGAVTAKVLAEAGLKVLVVEKSYYWAPEYLPMTEGDAPLLLFGNGGGHVSDDSTMTVVPGQTWGGGGTVNWSASLQPQGFVRREWADKFGLKHFTSSAFQADLDAVCERMGVGLKNVKHNKANTVLMEGARKLGWSAKPVPQNTGGEDHPDGYCTRGCRSCGKKGPTVTFLPDAADAGAKFMEGFDVKEILFGETNSSGNRQTTGVRGTWTSRDGFGGVAGVDKTTREVIIKARRTIISGGSVYTPILLKRSGLKNRHIGRHLRLHPVAMLGAVWDEDVRPWEGAILTSVCNEFENLDGEGYGAKLEATTMMPSSFLPLFPWTGGLPFKEFTAKMRRMTGYISLARDRYGGRVYPDPNDPSRANIDYHPSAYDKHHILAGLVGLAEIMYVEGAREIFATVPGLEPFVRPSSQPDSNIILTENPAPSVSDKEFQTWLTKLKTTGFPNPDTGFISAHQMGSCRMGTSKHNSVVDPKGRVWGTEGLYVADASVFPSASGVNPMITVMGVSRGIARGVVEDERAGGVGRARL
jgi:choline dehydrogenase-like flavoprotein